MTVSAIWCAVAELAASQHGVFHRSQAAKNGISARRLRTAVAQGRLARPLSDVYVFTATPPTWHQRLTVLSQAGGVVSHRSAAALHGLDGFPPGKLEVSMTRQRGRELPPRVTRHWFGSIDELDVIEDGGLRYTTVPRTLIDLAQVLPLRIVEGALDAALRSGWAIDEIEAVIDRLWRPGPTGLGPLRRLLRDPARQGALPDSLFERLLERLVLDTKLPAPVLQYEVRLRSGVRRLDLAWPNARVGVEAHSKRWHAGHHAWTDDNRRDLQLAAAGWEVVYVTWDMAQNPATFLDDLARLVTARLRTAS